MTGIEPKTMQDTLAILKEIRKDPGRSTQELLIAQELIEVVEANLEHATKCNGRFGRIVELIRGK
jgi:hypothetical protein